MFGVAAIGFLTRALIKNNALSNNSFSAFLGFRLYRSGRVSLVVLAAN
jgi:hypothetical protein